MCHGFLVHFAYIFIKLKRPISQRNLRLSDEITDKLQNCTVSCDKALYQTLHALHFIWVVFLLSQCLRSHCGWLLLKLFYI